MSNGKEIVPGFFYSACSGIFTGVNINKEHMSFVIQEY